MESSGKSFELKPRLNSDIYLHSLILSNTEDKVLNYIEDLIEKEQSFKNNGWPERLYMSISGCNKILAIPECDYQEIGYRALVYAIPFENIYEINSEFQSALHLAASRGMPRVVSRLIECKSDINARDASGRTALHHAVLNGDIGLSSTVIDILISKGIDLDIRDLSDQTARKLVLYSDTISEETLRKLTNTQALEQYKVVKGGIVKLKSEIAEEEGRLTEARKLKFEESLIEAKIGIDLSQNLWGREYWRSLESSDPLPYTEIKKNIDKQHLERVISILSQIINVKDEIEANFPNIKLGLHYLCSMINELSPETKGGYQEILWPEIEYLQNLIMSPENQVAQQLLREILPDLIKNDFDFLLEKFLKMTNEVKEWEEKNKNARSDLTPTFPKELFNLYCLVRYFHDLESLNSIIQFSKHASKLDLNDPLQRRELFFILRKIGDTSKYELLGTNLSIAVKSMVPDIPWDDLHKIRNTLKEAVYKFPERRKLIKKFITEEKIEELDLEGLRSDVVMLGQRLSEVQNTLMQLGYNSVGSRTTVCYLDSIRKFYAFERGHIEVDTNTVISEKDKKYLLQILEKYCDEDFKQRSEVKKITQELERTKKEIQDIANKKTIPENRKAELLEKRKRLEAEIIALFKPFSDKIHNNITFTKTDRAILKQWFVEEKYREFILTYFKGVFLSSFGLFDEVLSIGKKEICNDSTPNIQMQYLYLARVEKQKIFEILFPDEKVRNSIFTNIKSNRYHLNQVNEESTYFHQKLMEYKNNLEFYFRLNTVVIDFVLYLINSGVKYNKKMVKIMEHFDAFHNSFNFASKLEIFKELLSFLTDGEQKIESRDKELQEKGIAPVAQDIDKIYDFSSSTKTFTAISKALSDHSHKFKFFKKHSQAEQHISNILPIEGDGDCMYNSILEGLRRLPADANTNVILPNGTNIDLKNINLAQLRGIVADHIKANQGDFFALIAYQIAENIRHNELIGYPKDMSVPMQTMAADYRLNMQATEQRIQQFINGGVVGQYMDIMRNTHASGRDIVWGGGVELGIFSNLLSKQFYVHRRGGERYQINSTNQANVPRIDLDYTGNHYNLVLPHPRLTEEKISQQFQDSKLSKDCRDAKIKVNIKGIKKEDFESYCKSQLGISTQDLEYDGLECWIALDKKSIAILQDKQNAQSVTKMCYCNAVEYDNPILNDPKIMELFRLAKANFGMKGVNKLIVAGFEKNKYQFLQNYRKQLGDELAIKLYLSKELINTQTSHSFLTENQLVMFDEKLKAQLDCYSQEGVMFETLANHLHEYDSNTRHGLVDQPISYQGVSALY